MRVIVQAEKRGIPFYEIDRFSPVSNADLEWTLASYLLSKEHLSALSIEQVAGGHDERFQVENTPIGTPLGEMYAAQNVYWRNYSGGAGVSYPSSTPSHPAP